LLDFRAICLYKKYYNINYSKGIQDILTPARFYTRRGASQQIFSLWLPPFFAIALLALLLSPQLGYPLADPSGSLSDGSQPDGGRVGCPHCKNDGSEISQLLQKADALYAGFKQKEALNELLKVLQLDPQNHEALSKASRVYIDFGDMIPESGQDWQERKLKQYSIAENYARKAVKADANVTWGHFYIAASLGKIAAQSSIPKQIDLAKEIRTEVERAITLDPENGYAYHVYGVWHRKMAEIGKMSRVVASVFLWRSVPKGSMEKAVEYLNKAIYFNPTIISHHLELARTYVAMGKYQLARTSLKSVQELPIQFSDDPQNKREAQQLAQEIKDR
jgi:FimV-like protein